jgi:hypothetical protein
MLYREMLERCLKSPGWLGIKEQKDSDSKLNYSFWVKNQNMEYSKGKSEANVKDKI